MWAIALDRAMLTYFELQPHARFERHRVVLLRLDKRWPVRAPAHQLARSPRVVPPYPKASASCAPSSRVHPGSPPRTSPFHTVAVKTDGTLWAWGDNTHGQLGNGTPLGLQIGSALASVAAGSNHTVSLTTDGTLWAWGDNSYGQLGDGTTTQRNAPVQIGTEFASLAAGYDHTVAVKSDGTVWAWGSDTWGELGDGGGNKSVPVRVP